MGRTRKPTYRSWSAWIGWWLVLSLVAAPVTAGATQKAGNDTLLMFVGEKLDVMNIATRREESAWQVPAIAQVITRAEILEKGLQTLSQALALVPGFHMAAKEDGSQPYLRGIANGVLILYDTVPLSSSVSKALHGLDRDISLAAVKRIEIIRGPGSVLWGPDAYAGVVNIVPLSGKEVESGEVGLSVGGPDRQTGAFANVGTQAGKWDTFFSVSAHNRATDDSVASIARFWGDLKQAVPAEERSGAVTLGDTRYIEASGRIAYDERLLLTGRVADAQKPYTFTDAQDSQTWREEKRVSSGFAKLEYKHDLGIHSGLRWMGSYSWLDPDFEIIDRTLHQREKTFYAEMIYDQSLRAGQSLFTGGLSFRENRVQGAPVWDGYLPDYLDPQNDTLLPQLSQVDYESRLISAFAQYVHKIGKVDLLAGLRYDQHDAYADALSYNTGMIWSPSSPWVFKLLHGTAYRTPYARQLRGSDDIDPEKIVNFSAQAGWRPSTLLNGSLTLFSNRLENHVLEDPYAGLSTPNSQTIYGLELDMAYRPVPWLGFDGNLTLMNNSGTDELYRYNDYSFIDETTGELVRHYVDLRYPYDTGAKRLFNLTATFTPSERWTTRATARYIGPRDLVHPRGETLTHCGSVWLLDWSVTVHNLMTDHLDLTLALANVLDEHYLTPGTYTTIEGDPLTVCLTFRYHW